MEAMRLTKMLVDYAPTDQPKVNALYALMCFHSSRLPARKSSEGEIVLYGQQDENRWNRELISTGAYFLKKGSVGNILSSYHIEAAIAYWHTVKPDTIEKWKNILQLYDHLLEIRYTPVAALNRLLALSKVKGKEVAIETAESLALHDNHFFHLLLGELYSATDTAKANECFTKAAGLAKTASEKNMIKRKLK